MYSRLPSLFPILIISLLVVGCSSSKGRINEVNSNIDEVNGRINQIEKRLSVLINKDKILKKQLEKNHLKSKENLNKNDKFTNNLISLNNKISILENRLVKNDSVAESELNKLNKQIHKLELKSSMYNVCEVDGNILLSKSGHKNNLQCDIYNGES